MSWKQGVAIGINDSIVENNQERSSADKYHQEIQTLIELSNKESDKILFIGLTPVDEETANSRPGKPKEYNNERIKEFDNSLEQACRHKNAAYLRIFKTLLTEMSRGEQLFDDGLHPNHAGHQLIFELVQPELDKLLK